MIAPKHPLRAGYVGALYFEKCEECGERFPRCYGQLVAQFPSVKSEADHGIKACPRCLHLDGMCVPGGLDTVRQIHERLYHVNSNFHAAHG